MPTLKDPAQKNTLKVLGRVASSPGIAPEVKQALIELEHALSRRGLESYDELVPHGVAEKAAAAALFIAQAPLRHDAMRAIFATTHPPRPGCHHEKLALSAMTEVAVDQLPFLHAKGFGLSDHEGDLAMAMQLSLRLLKLGIWPHLDLVAPSLLLKMPKAAIGGLISPAPDPAFANLRQVLPRLLQLPVEKQRLCEEASCLFLTAAAYDLDHRNCKRWFLDVGADRLLVLARLVDHGWLDTDHALELAAFAPGKQGLSRLVAAIDQVRLDWKTGSQSHVRVGLRL